MTPQARGQDVSGLYQNPADMRYADWRRELGFCFGFYEVAIGLRHIQWAAEHRAAMRAAGYLTGPYMALSEIGSPLDQCRLLLDSRGADDELPNMLDVERSRLTLPMLLAFCDYYDAHTLRELVIYTGVPAWTRTVPLANRARFARYGVIIAGYPFDSPSTDAQGNPKSQPMDPASVGLRSTPPLTRRPDIPAPWTREWAWQHTGHGRLPGYGHDLDLQVHALTEAELRAKYGTAAPPVHPPPVPVEPTWTIAEMAAIAGAAREVRAAAAQLATLEKQP